MRIRQLPLTFVILYRCFQIQNVIWCDPQEDQKEDSTASFKRSRYGSLSNSPDSSPTSMTSLIPKYTIDEENWLQGKERLYSIVVRVVEFHSEAGEIQYVFAPQ